MKKIFLGMAFLLAALAGKAQNGLENIIVEKYYVSNAADAAGSVGALPVGSVTYRIYADMLPGYKFQAAYGVNGHPLVLSTSTSFFNNEDRGATTPTYTKTQARANTVMLDSWLSVGAACSGNNFGVLKSEDDVTLGGATVVNSNVPPILQNNDASAGIPISVQDGIWTAATAPEAVTFVGISATDLSMFDATSQAGNSFTTINGSWAALNGATGPTASNRVLIAQITTDGIFTYELNIQIGTPTGGVQNFVASNPVGSEIQLASLSGILGAPNVLPVVTLTSPSNGASFLTGSTVTLSANAADSDGSIASVDFLVDNVVVNSDITSPYSFNWTATAGNHTVAARATDNSGGISTTPVVNISVATNTPPVVSITSPAAGSLFTAPATVNITANATDANGTVSQVEFFVNGVSVGTDNTSPYAFNWTSVIGTAVLTAVATDNNGASTTSAAVTINVLDPNALPYRIDNLTQNCSNSSFCLPISATDTVSNIIGYDITMTYNKNKVTPSGGITVANDLINPIYVDLVSTIDTAAGTIAMSLFFNSSAPASAAFSGMGELVCVEFTKNASFNFNDTANFTLALINESYFTGVVSKLGDPGKFISFKDSLYNAEVRFWGNNSPLAYDPFNPSQYLVTNIFGNNGACNSRSVSSVQPNLSGQFSYNLNNGLNIEIVRDINGSVSVQPVINGFDAFLSRKVLVGDRSFIPSVYQMIAMDVNIDGVVSAGDVSQINQRAVLMIPEFRQAWNYNAAGVSNGQPSKDWLFIDGTTVRSTAAYQISTSYPSDNGIGYSRFRVPVTPFCLGANVTNFSTCPEIINGETYRGVLIGDINGNFGSIGSGGVYRTSNDNSVVFDLNAAVINGEIVEVPVKVSSTEDINAVDFAFNTINYGLEFVEVRPMSAEIQSMSYNDGSAVRFTSNSMTKYEENTPVAVIRFRSATGQISASDFGSVEGYINGEQVAVSYNTDKIVAGASSTIHVYPNPVKDVLNIVAGEDAEVTVTDIAGSVTFIRERISADQVSTFSTATFANGVYLISIIGNSTNEIRKVVVQR